MNECLMKCGNEIEKQKLNEADFLLKFYFFQLRDGGAPHLISINGSESTVAVLLRVATFSLLCFCFVYLMFAWFHFLSLKNIQNNYFSISLSIWPGSVVLRLKSQIEEMCNLCWCDTRKSRQQTSGGRSRYTLLCVVHSLGRVRIGRSVGPFHVWDVIEFSYNIHTYTIDTTQGFK